jgi:hypothetical protein
MMGMGGIGMGGGSMMDEMSQMSQRMDAMQQSMMSSFHSSFGHHHANGQPSFSSSFSTSSSSGIGGGRSVSTSTSTRIVNGVQETITERTVVHPDGRVERSSSTNTNGAMGGIGGRMALGAGGNDRHHRRYIDQEGRR